MKTVLVKNRPVREVGDIFTYKDKQYRAASTSYERDGEVFIDVETEDNAFWKIARRDDIEAKLTNLVNFIRGQGANEYPDVNHHGLMIQGELVAPNIQGNFEGVDKPEFYVYNIFNIDTQQFTRPLWTRIGCVSMNLKHVPVLHNQISLKTLFPEATQDTIIGCLLAYADGPSSFGGSLREGLVFKRADGQFSFKAISNRYLEKEKA